MSTNDSELREIVERALRAATRAPSVHNTQPWLFVVRPPYIELRLDRDRVLPVADPDAREAMLSCGAALLNLRIAVQAADRSATTDLLPDPNQPDLLAIVRIGGYHLASPELRSLATAIHRRATNRRPFLERRVPMTHRRVLMSAAEHEGCRLHVLDTPKSIETFARLLRRADHLQEEDPGFQTELREWTTRATSRQDGVPQAAGGPRPIGGMLLKLRRFHDSGAGADRPFEQEPLVAALTSPGDAALDRIRAGQAMQRVLLNATASGLSASFLSQPIEVPYIRADLRNLLGGRHHPQTVFRIGFGHPPAPTPRRPVTTVTTFPADFQSEEVLS
jgi:hypothetical protein